MEDGYHINVARVGNKESWNSTRGTPKYDAYHYCHIFLGRHLVAGVANDIRARFPEGDAPGQFKVTMTYWESHGVRLDFTDPIREVGPLLK